MNTLILKKFKQFWLNFNLVIIMSFILISGFLIIFSFNISAENPANINYRYLISDVVDKLTPSVVSIQVLKKEESFEKNFWGSGFIIDEKGLIITNQHVIEDAEEIYIQLFDKTLIKNIEIIGSDKNSDIAILKIPKKEINYLLPSVKIGDPSKMRVGESVVAFGSPFANHIGSELTVTSGIISTKSRMIETKKTVYQKFIQTDAAINPGNSGGPLVNLAGEVIAINSAILSTAQGISFAIPINYALEIKKELIENGKISRPWTGLSISKVPLEYLKSYGLKNNIGVYIDQVHPDSPAKKSNLKKGDIILEINNKKIKNPKDFVEYVQNTKIGESISLSINYQGQMRQTVIKIGEKQN